MTPASRALGLVTLLIGGLLLAGCTPLSAGPAPLPVPSALTVAPQTPVLGSSCEELTPAAEISALTGTALPLEAAPPDTGTVFDVAIVASGMRSCTWADSTTRLELRALPLREGDGFDHVAAGAQCAPRENALNCTTDVAANNYWVSLTAVTPTATATATAEGIDERFAELATAIAALIERAEPATARTSPTNLIGERLCGEGPALLDRALGASVTASQRLTDTEPSIALASRAQAGAFTCTWDLQQGDTARGSWTFATVPEASWAFTEHSPQPIHTRDGAWSTTSLPWRSSDTDAHVQCGETLCEWAVVLDDTLTVAVYTSDVGVTEQTAHDELAAILTAL